MLWLVNAVFTQKFISFDNVSLKTDTIGLQLPKQADVKVRGVIVGQVNKIASNGKGATLTLGIKPDKISQIPANVTAAILPKTLFGEKYVELQIPKDPSSTSLKAGDTITQTKLPIEVEKVLNDLYPLLRTVQPAELNYTLNALATALEGRGNKIGESLGDPRRLPEADEPPAAGADHRHQAARARSPTSTPTSPRRWPRRCATP